MTEGRYEVGYGRPPRRTQFKKGQSGNRAGRPKGARGLLAELEKELASVVSISSRGRNVSVSKMALLVKAMVAAAIKGDAAARRDLIAALDKAGWLTTPRAQNDNAELAPDDEAILDAFIGQKSRAGENA